MKYQIAIDGPSGVGKSTTAKKLANKLSFTYVDTGAMYRAAGLYMTQNNIDINDEKKVEAEIEKVDIDLEYKDNTLTVYLNENNVTDIIRTSEISKAASVVSQYKKVRERLVNIQRHMASTKNVIMDGRDIGTVVLPNAFLKIFLVCNYDERAKRVQKDLLAKGEEKTVEQVKQDLIERDNRDTTRKESPLVKAKDHIEVDTSNNTIDEITDKIYNLFMEKKEK